MRNSSFASSVILLSILTAACQNPNKYARSAESADAIYYGGDIITMEDSATPYADALAIKDGKIVFVGSKSDADHWKGDSTITNDLQGKTLLPGFIDAHGHVGSYGLTALAVNLLPEPYGSVMSIHDLQGALREYIRRNDIPAGALIIGNGYDDSAIKEHRHPSASELDAVSTTNPIYILHTSGHMGIANTLFMQKIGVDYHTPDPVGGAMERDNTIHKLTGKMIENANIKALLYLQKLRPAPPAAKRFDALLASEKVWFENGQTTICEGRATPATIHLIKDASAKGLLRGDFVVLPDYDTNVDSLNVWSKYYGKYVGHFKVGGIKLTFDGSPQGKSAWLTQPYISPPAGEKPNFKGTPIYTSQAGYEAMKNAFSHGMQVHGHCNGDAAIDEYLNLLDTLGKQGFITSGMRNVIVHAQVCRPDQVPRLKELNIIPTWFPTHCYLWGDWHYENVLGPERAGHISPLRQGLENGILFTIHTDAPVTPPDLMTAVYAAVNRRTRSGMILGEDQCISPYEALKAITINAAYQWSEESEKGSLKKGKRADLVILDKNPLKVDPLTIRDIHVVETIKDGQTVYKKM